MTLTLVIGGTRSGKSAHAERLAASTGLPVRYVGTADPSDASMSERIASHQERRPAHWETLDAGDALASTLLRGGVTLLDGLGGWIAGHSRASVTGEIEAIISAAAVEDVIVVAEQAGEGLLPLNAAAREWIDLLGESLQRLSAAADRVLQVVAGRVLELPPASHEEPIRLPTRPGAPPRPQVDQRHHGDLRHHGDRDVRPGDRDHAVNVLAGGPPPWLRATLQAALDGDAVRYPDERAATIAIAAMHGRDPAEVVLTNGAAEALWLLAPALAPRLAAIVQPGFTETEAALRAHQIPVIRVHREARRGFLVTPDLVPASADLVVVTNPGSPDGTGYVADDITALRAPDRVVVVDEAFMSMVPGEPGSLVREQLSDVVVVRSLTKLLSVPGLRVGYVLAPPHLAERLAAVRPPWSANAMALAALSAAAEHPQELAELALRADRERRDLAERLGAMSGVKVWPSVANFCLIEVPGGRRVASELRARGIAVRLADTFPGLSADHIRITARDPEANAALVAALAEAIGA